MHDGDFLHACSFHMNDVVDVLQRTFEEKELALNDRGAIALEDIRRDDDVGNTGFIFKAEEDEAFRGAGTLPRNDAAGNANPAAVGDACQIARAQNAQRVQFLAAIGHRMRTDRHARAVEIGDEPFFGCHDVERGRLFSGFELLQQRARPLRGAFHLPKRITPMRVIVRIEKIQRADFRQLHEFVLLKFGNATGKVVDGSERALVARADERTPRGFAQAADVAKADAQGVARGLR